MAAKLKKLAEEFFDYSYVDKQRQTKRVVWGWSIH